MKLKSMALPIVSAEATFSLCRPGARCGCAPLKPVTLFSFSDRPVQRASDYGASKRLTSIALLRASSLRGFANAD